VFSAAIIRPVVPSIVEEEVVVAIVLLRLLPIVEALLSLAAMGIKAAIVTIVLARARLVSLVIALEAARVPTTTPILAASTTS